MIRNQCRYLNLEGWRELCSRPREKGWAGQTTCDHCGDDGDDQDDGDGDDGDNQGDGEPVVVPVVQAPAWLLLVATGAVDNEIGWVPGC